MHASENQSMIEVTGNLVSAVLHDMGDDWEQGKLALSQIYMSGLLCEEIIDKLIPAQSSTRISQPKMAIGVFEDYHMLGKRIVYSSLRACGYELMDLGGGLKTAQLLEIVQKEKVRILLISVLMLPSALHIKELSKQLSNSDVKLVVGGAPFRFDDALWQEVGADACGKDASEAVRIVSKLITEMK
jgi:monomethylamine corrinoid protein